MQRSSFADSPGHFNCPLEDDLALLLESPSARAASANFFSSHLGTLDPNAVNGAYGECPAARLSSVVSQPCMFQCFNQLLPTACAGCASAACAVSELCQHLMHRYKQLCSSACHLCHRCHTPSFCNVHGHVMSTQNDRPFSVHQTFICEN